MRLFDEEYKVDVQRVEKLDSNALGECDLVVDVREGEDDGPDFGLVIRVDGPSASRKAAIRGSWQLSEESSVVMKDGAITVLADPCVLQIRLSDLIVTRSRQLETLGENFEIHDVPAGFLIFGELEIAMLDGSLDTMWSFSGPDAFFGNNNGPAFALNEDRIVLNDFLGDHFELDFDGNLVVEEMADG